MIKPDVILLHGVLMNAMEMLFLKRQLEKHGFRVHSLSYASVKYSIEENTQHLYDKIIQLNCKESHIVAHSLGGIMSMHLLEKHPELPFKRIVMLGTPINGSYAAKVISRWKVVGRLLSKCMKDGLAGSPGYKVSYRYEIGMIAGSINSPIGFGLLLGKLPEANDGTVLLSETKHPLVTEHLVVNKSHTGLVFSPTVGKLVANFLRRGDFSS